MMHGIPLDGLVKFLRAVNKLIPGAGNYSIAGDDWTAPKERPDIEVVVIIVDHRKKTTRIDFAVPAPEKCIHCDAEGEYTFYDEWVCTCGNTAESHPPHACLAGATRVNVHDLPNVDTKFRAPGL